jgi:nucleoside-diphosphate kinase
MIEKTLAMIKPDGVARKLVGKTISRIEQEGFRIVEMRMTTLSKKMAGSLYAPHEGKKFYDSLMAFVTSGPVVLMVLERENCISHLRNVVGATDPAEAQAGTLRNSFATDLQKNVIHASETPDDATREISLFFDSQ